MESKIERDEVVRQPENNDVDYTLTHVPQHARKHWIQIFAVLIGFTFIVTTMAAGADIGTSLTMSDLFIALLVGNLILSTFIATICWIAAKTGLNTMLLARYSLGQIGSKWTSIILGGAQVVWYAFQAAYMGFVFAASLGLDDYVVPITIFWSLVMGSTAIWGSKGLEIVAYLSIPPFLYLAYTIPAEAINMAGGIENLFLIEPESTITLATAMTVVIGAFVAGGLQTPNWARFARTPKTGFLVAFMAFMIGNIVMGLSGALGGLVMAESDMVNILLGMGIIVMAMVVLIFNIWTTNNTSAYSFGVAGAELFNKPNKVPFVIGGLIIATILAVTGIYEAFISIVEFFGIFLPPLGGVIIADYLFNWRKSLPRIEYVKFQFAHYGNWVAYILATVGAFLSSVFEIGLPSVNGIILAVVLVYVVNKIFKALGISNSHEISSKAEYIE